MSKRSRPTPADAVCRISRIVGRRRKRWPAPAQPDAWSRCAAIDEAMASMLSEIDFPLSLEDFGAEDPDAFDRLHALIDGATAHAGEHNRSA